VIRTTPAGRSLFRIGGACAITVAVIYLVIIVLFAFAGTLPNGAEAALKYLDHKSALWSAIVALSVLTDVLYIPVGLSLYFALREINHIAALVGVAFMFLFVGLDLAVTWTNYASLIVLSGHYAAASSDAQRAAYVAAADYSMSVLSSRTETVYAIVDLSFGILVIGVAMLRGVFNRPTAYLGIATGIVGILTLSGLFVTVILNAILAIVWLFFVGYRLYRLTDKEPVQENPIR
jgi:hypothetical protein